MTFVTGTHQTQASTWVLQGALVAVKLGPGKRLIRVRRCDLEDFIAQGAMNDPGSNGGAL
jgi:hypothetical protein